MKRSFKSNVIIFLFSIFFVSFAGVTILNILKYFKVDITNKNLLLFIDIMISIIFIAILCFIYKNELKDNLKDYKKNYRKYLSSGICLWGLGLLIMLISNCFISLIYNPTSGNEEALSNIFMVYPFYVVYEALIHAPFTEEILYRKQLSNLVKNKTMYIILSGLLFGFVHTLVGLNNNYLELLYIIPYGTMGAIFAYMYKKTDNIFVPITFHFLHNFLSILVSFVSLA